MANEVRPVLLLSRPPRDSTSMTTAVEDSASERPMSTAAPARAPYIAAIDADDHRRDGDLQRAEPEHQAAHGQQPLERQLQPDDEQQEHDAELGHGAEPALLGDGHPLAAAE